MMRPLALVFLLLAAPAVAAGFDAIAIDDPAAGGNGDYAVGEGPTAREAQRIALSNCTAGGNPACRLRLTYRQCGAYAASGARNGTGTGATAQVATAAALASCGGAACHLVVADCAGAPLRAPDRD